MKILNVVSEEITRKFGIKSAVSVKVINTFKKRTNTLHKGKKKGTSKSSQKSVRVHPLQAQECKSTDLSFEKTVPVTLAQEVLLR